MKCFASNNVKARGGLGRRILQFGMRPGYKPSTQYAHLASDILILARANFHDPYLW